MAQKTTLTLSLSREEIQQSTTAVLKHLNFHQPDSPTLDYNIGIHMLFEVLENTFETNKQ